MSDLAERLIGEEEGRKPTVYQDSRGYSTIGIGALVDPRVTGAGLCDAAIDAQFAHDSAAARTEASTMPNFAKFNDVQQAVLVSMCFQLGGKPLHWPNFMAALTAGDPEEVSAAMLDSDWARTQTPKRAHRAAYMFKSGTWLDHGAEVPNG